MDRRGCSSSGCRSGVGVRFVSITHGIDIHPGGEAMSRLMLTMLSAVADFERELIVERTKLGLARARENGKTLGRPRAILEGEDSGAGPPSVQTAGEAFELVRAEVGLRRHPGLRTGPLHSAAEPDERCRRIGRCDR
ncbi:MAG: recombinase family protein [Myxococcota bacterium]